MGDSPTRARMGCLLVCLFFFNAWSTILKLIFDPILVEMKPAMKTLLMIDVWDYGGQRVFYSLHHVLLSREAVYILVFNMAQIMAQIKDLKTTTLVTVDVVADGDEDYLNDMDSLGYISFWLQSLQQHAPKSKVVLVGTHWNEVFLPCDHKIISDYLFKYFKAKCLTAQIQTNTEHRLFFFPVDNTRKINTANIGILRKSLSTYVSQLPSAKKLVDLNILAFRDALVNLGRPASKYDSNIVCEMRKRQGHSDGCVRRLTLQDVHLLARSCNLLAPLSSCDDSQFKDILIFLRDLNVILFFKNTENLKALQSLVFLDPFYFVDCITRIIFNADLHSENLVHVSDEHSAMVDDFCKTGILHAELLAVLWYENTLIEREMLKECMIYFNLMVPSKKQSYLVPNMSPKVGAEQAPELSFCATNTILIAVSHDNKFQPVFPPCVTTEQLNEKCYLLEVFFPRIVCLFIEYFEEEFGTSNFMQVYRDYAIFGVKTQFLELHLHPTQTFPGDSPRIPKNALVLTTNIKNGFAIARRTINIVAKVLQSVSDSLRCWLFVPYYAADSKTYLSLEGLQSSYEQSEKGFTSAGAGGARSNIHIEKVDIMKHYSQWLPSVHCEDAPIDIMISYRQKFKDASGKDAGINLAAPLLWQALRHIQIGSTLRGPLLFFDKHDITYGTHGSRAFVKAIFNATICIPIISVSTLKKLEREEQLDNMLMEWTLMVCCKMGFWYCRPTCLCLSCFYCIL